MKKNNRRRSDSDEDNSGRCSFKMFFANWKRKYWQSQLTKFKGG